jgi:hypothetical protein
MNNTKQKKSLRPYSWLSRPEPLLLLPSSSSVALTRLNGPSSRPTTFFCSAENRTRDLRICSQELWPLDLMVFNFVNPTWAKSKDCNGIFLRVYSNESRSNLSGVTDLKAFRAGFRYPPPGVARNGVTAQRVTASLVNKIIHGLRCGWHWKEICQGTV